MIKKNNTQCIILSRNLTDLVKFIACLMIALHHYSQGMVIAGTHNLIYMLFSTQGGWLGVAIFFFLSGYGLMKSDLMHHLSLVQFMKKRLLKTYLPAILISLLWGGYLLAIGGGKFQTLHIEHIIWYFNDEVLWFVRAICKLYVLFYIYAWSRLYFKTTCIGDRMNLILLITIAAIAVWWVDAGLVHGSSVVLFFIGISLAEHDGLYIKFIRKRYPVIALFLLFLAMGLINMGKADIIHLLINYILVSSGIILMAFYDVEPPTMPQWMRNTSYDIYLVHNKVLMLLRPVYTTVPLWLFIGLTALFTMLFYQIRKLMHI